MYRTRRARWSDVNRSGSPRAASAGTGWAPEHAKGATAGAVTPSSLERPTGFEPATSSLGSWHSATELRPPTASYSSLLEGHVEALQPLVAARLPHHPLGGPVEVELLVERHRGGVLTPE